MILVAALLVFSLPSSFAAPAASVLKSDPKSGAKNAETAARALLRSHLSALQGKTGKFNAGGCAKVPPSAWASLILLQKPIEHEVKFGPGCDAQGVVRITLEPFPIDLKLRNLPDVERIQGRIAVDLSPRLLDQEADLDFDATQAKAFDAEGTELLGFRGAYGVTLGMDGKVARNRGGKLSADRYRGVAVKVVEPLRFK